MASDTLLHEPDRDILGKYYDQITNRLGAAVEVRLEGDSKGKGIYATSAFKQGDRIFEERPLAGVQTLENKADVTACSHCFRPIGTVEKQIGGMLCNLINILSSPAEEDDLQEVQDRIDKIQAAVNASYLEGLLEGQVQLPHADFLQMPQPVACRRHCGEEYCSEECRAAAWSQQHCLLCPQGPQDPNQPSSGSSGASTSKGGAAAGSSSKPHFGRAGSSSGSSSSVGPEDVEGLNVLRAHIGCFLQHADETNDIFRVVAQVIANTMLKANTLLAQQQEGQWGDQAEIGATPAAEPLAPGAGSVASKSKSQTADAASIDRALRHVLLPWAAAHKAVWWEAVAVPEGEEEVEFRAQLRELALESLELLRGAFPDTPFTHLFDLQVYGQLIGVFELNNLAVSVPSPIKEYFDGLADPEVIPDERERLSAQALTQPLREALGDALDAPVQGTAFYALQSCANHSCSPNAQAAGEFSGGMHVIAVRNIEPGEEIVISYIDESADYEERQGMLEDYGFVCECAKCLEEKAALAIE